MADSEQSQKNTVQSATFKSIDFSSAFIVICFDKTARRVWNKKWLANFLVTAVISILP